MSTAEVAQVINQLIERLPRKERNGILKRCETVELVVGTTLCEPNQSFQHVYFPLSGFISLLTTIDGHQPLETALIGNEGMLGATLALGVNAAPERAVVQGAGTALRMTVAQCRLALRDSTNLLRIFNRYLYVQIAQLSQTGACTHFHKIGPRLVRWLLMTHDRAHADHFYLTHKYLADMLGVRRSSITIAAGILQRKKLISYNRGEILILDRKGLEAACCECYDIMSDHYARLLA
ncbi:Crp/Fnr family transcriptional regulator [Nitrosomonas sp. ANs5]|uniref:Crp/Fnr family transcriptional regulator n=1 Tax=Nitrosomonas sp. ANs5 TaxID=3423941 RepID=UPI003D356428